MISPDRAEQDRRNGISKSDAWKAREELPGYLHNCHWKAELRISDQLLGRGEKI